MYRRLLLTLNIKQHEFALVRKLFTVQFFLGIATAFYFTSTLAMFLSTYTIEKLPIVYIISALFLFVINRIYAYLDEHLNSPRLLEWVILFSASLILIFWLLLTFVDFSSLKLLIAAAYMIIYMLVGYAFWGMASMMFNVRESKRLFSLVGAGDIPAKMLGYFAVSALIPVMSINNLLWVSIVSFVIAFFLMKRYQNQGFINSSDPNEHHEHPKEEDNLSVTEGLLKRFFFNRLILYIALLSIVSYVVFALIDFTFLADIKVKFKKGEQMATFIGIFFAIGRVFAIAIKLLFSSRMIARIGLTNSLLVTPVLLLVINLVLIISKGPSLQSHLIIFGTMVLLTEILRSTLQEPVFFILFQPLQPHDRLRGHLVAKGYTMPIALIGVGAFLYFILQSTSAISITTVAQILIVFIVLWIASIFMIKKQYLATLISSLKKGYFTGAELFLNDSAVTDLLLVKARSTNSIEVIHSLNLLERSGYQDIHMLLLQHINHPTTEIKEYVLGRIIENKITGALPLIEQQIQQSSQSETLPALIKAYYFLNKNIGDNEAIAIDGLTRLEKKPAIIGLLYRQDEKITVEVNKELLQMAASNTEDKLMVLDIVMEAPRAEFGGILKNLLLDKHAPVYKRAIEATGKIKDFDLFIEMVEVAVKNKALPSLQRSLLYYGDEVFSTDYWNAENIPEPLMLPAIKTASKIKGENSTLFLFRLLKASTRHSEAIINSLWLKRSEINDEGKGDIDRWAQQKMEETKIKIGYFNDLQNLNPLKLLREAVGRELQSDLTVLLKSFSLIFDRQKVDRVIELIGLDNETRIFNAIEVLELILPGKYFNQVNVLVELMNDIRKNEVLLPNMHDWTGNHLIEKLLKDSAANFNEWTRSVACYMLPKIKTKEFSLNVLRSKANKGEVLFNETRNYVLSILK